MKTIIILMAVMFCSFSAYSHITLNDDITHYIEIDKTRFEENIYSSVIVCIEEGFFIDSYYIHYHVYTWDKKTNRLITKYDIPHYKREYTFEISRSAYVHIRNTSDYISFRPLDGNTGNRVLYSNINSIFY